MILRIGDVEVDDAAREVKRRGVLVEAEPKVFDVLVYLVRHRQRVVGKDELLDALWEGRTVSESVLARAIHSARRLVGDASVIKTLYGRGYRFVGSALAIDEPCASEGAGTLLPVSGSSGAGATVTTAQPAKRLIGRHAELAVASECLESALAGRTRTLTVTGEAGVGKTAICENVATLSEQSGAKAIWGRCSEVPGAPAYWPFIQILRSLGAVVPPERFEPLLDAHASVRELASQHALASLAIRDGEQARFRLFDSVSRVFRGAAAAVPLTLLIDDLHCVDTPSLLLLNFLTEQLVDARAFIVAAYREAEMRTDPERSRWMSELARRPNTHAVALRGLGAAEIGLFVEAATGSAPDQNTVGLLVEQTAGNPFYLSQVVPLLANRKRASQESSSAGVVTLPSSARDAVEGHLSTLRGGARHALEAAAVIGRDFELGLLARALGTESSEVLKSLEPTRSAGLIAERGASAKVYRFAHVIVRDTLYLGLSAPSRGALHRLVGEALEQMHLDDIDAVASALSHHFTHATGIDGSSKPIEYATMAGDLALSRFAYEDAAREFERAVAVASSAPERDERLYCDLLLKLASAYTRSGHPDPARETFKRAAAQARRIQEPRRLAMVALDLAPGFFSMEAGHVDKYLIERLDESLAAIQDQDPELRARLLGRLAIALHYTDQEARCPELCAEAIAIADQVGTPEARLHALEAQHGALWSLDNAESRLEWSREMIALSERLDDVDTQFVSRMFRMNNLLEQGDMDSFREELNRFTRLAHGVRQPGSIWFAEMYENMLALARGEFERVERFGVQSIELGQRIRYHSAYQSGGVYVMLTRCERSDTEDILPILEHNMDTYPLGSWCGAYMLTCTRAGDDERTRKALKRALSLQLRTPRNPTWLSGMTAFCEAVAHLAAGEEAAVLREQLADVRVPYVLIGYGCAILGALDRSRGLLAIAEERWTDAIHLLDSAVEQNSRIGLVTHVAHAQRELAKALIRRGAPGDRARAERCLEQALGTAERLGMTWLIGQVQALHTR